MNIISPPLINIQIAKPTFLQANQIDSNIPDEPVKNLLKHFNNYNSENENKITPKLLQN